MHLGIALGRNDDWHSVDLLYTLTNGMRQHAIVPEVLLK